jgi:hypothetical protein
MTTGTLEERVAAVEQELAELKHQVKSEPTRLPWWEKIAGTFANNPEYDEAMRLGREWRQSQREDYDRDEDGKEAA